MTRSAPSSLLAISPVLLLAVLVACAGHAVNGRPPAGGAAGAGTSAADDRITAQVKTVLLNDPQISATRIDVTTANGVVTISGIVRSQAEEQRAVQLARQVSGVKDVRSTLTIPQS